MGLRRAGVRLGLGEHDDDVYDAEEALDDDFAGEEADGGASGLQIAIVRPRTFRDALTIGEYYRQDIPVIMNFEDMDSADARRIIDFASGLILGRRGDIERLSAKVFMIMPAGSSFITDDGKIADEGFYNQT
ncbi:cell division protein SepF [Sinosporangium siamense]|uniref:cell division protein SepF n=1 Tax=Sinosporangium siamense TaxID=1367973 RepID=UPI001950D712|nr:cell division protein SepF [Sinosporangium siamense]